MGLKHIYVLIGLSRASSLHFERPFSSSAPDDPAPDIDPSETGPGWGAHVAASESSKSMWHTAMKQSIGTGCLIKPPPSFTQVVFRQIYEEIALAPRTSIKHLSVGANKSPSILKFGRSLGPSGHASHETSVHQRIFITALDDRVVHPTDCRKDPVVGSGEALHERLSKPVVASASVVRREHNGSLRLPSSCKKGPTRKTNTQHTNTPD